MLFEKVCNLNHGSLTNGRAADMDAIINLEPMAEFVGRGHGRTLRKNRRIFNREPGQHTFHTIGETHNGCIRPKGHCLDSVNHP